MIASAISVVVGLALAAGGVRLIRASEVKPGDTSFSSLLSARALTLAGGWVSLFTGLYLAMILAPMLYLKG